MKVQAYLDSDLQALIENSRTHPRLRAAKTFQDPNNPNYQMLFNAMQPGSYLPPHAHYHPEVWMPLRGWFLLGTFDENGNIKKKYFPLLKKEQYTRKFQLIFIIQQYPWLKILFSVM